ncbi:MAG: hypothetical protein WCA84_16590 [Ignavibacteriaceae bacterium]
MNRKLSEPGSSGFNDFQEGHECSVNCPNQDSQDSRIFRKGTGNHKLS